MASRKGNSNEHEILEHSRSAALESAADLLESIAHAQKLRKRAESTFEDRRQPGAKDGESGDFLFDMLRLNAHYLNELAKLGSRHKAVAQRALENFYALANPGVRNPSASELEFSLDKQLCKFAVQNDVNPEAEVVTLEWASIERPSDRKKTNPFEIEYEGKGGEEPELAEGRCTIDVGVLFAVPKVVTLKLKMADAEGVPNFLERRYRLDLLVKLELKPGRGKQVRRIPITVDARVKASDRSPVREQGRE